jgi:hypothetical protein
MAVFHTKIIMTVPATPVDENGFADTPQTNSRVRSSARAAGSTTTNQRGNFFIRPLASIDR